MSDEALRSRFKILNRAVDSGDLRVRIDPKTRRRVLELRVDLLIVHES